MKQLITILVFVLHCMMLLGQSNPCDYAQINNSDFDQLFQKEFAAIQADSILAFRHCPSTNGCNNTIGVLCWKINKQYFYKKIQKKDGEIKITTELRYGLMDHLESFYKNKIFTVTGDVSPNIYIDDGQFTKIVFKAKDFCWHLELGYLYANDIRVIWAKELLSYYIRF